MSDAKIVAINPRTGEADYTVDAISVADVDALAARLRNGQKAWAAASIDHRIAVLSRWADAIAANSAAIADAESRDTGRHRLSYEAPHLAIGAIRAWCAAAPQVIASAERSGPSSLVPGTSFETQLVPYGLIGAVTPWNQPLVLSLIDAVPALLAGCAMIVKPSEVTPRFIEPMMQTVAAVPELAEVFAMVAGGPDAGRAILNNSDAFCFTGSVRTGKVIAEACARKFIPAFLELGGNDAVIVTRGADLPSAAAAVMRGSVYATGQVCFSVERVYVDAEVHDDFVDYLTKEAQLLDINYPDIHSGHIGPFTMPAQADIADAHIADAVAKGARIVSGGPSETLGGGRYMRPTILTDVNHEMDVMTDETFAPITPVMRYHGIDEAIALANDSDFGLSAAVIAETADEAATIARQLDAGAISLQDAALTLGILRDAEKTSFNMSGLGGSRMGPNAILRFLRRKALISSTNPPVSMSALGEF